MKYESPISFSSKVIAKVKFFQKKIKSQGQGHEVKNFGIDTRNTHVKYESYISIGSKVMPKVKFTLDRQTDKRTDRQTG